MGNQHANHTRIHAAPLDKSQNFIQSVHDETPIESKIADTLNQQLIHTSTTPVTNVEDDQQQDSSHHDFNFDTTEFIYSHSIPYSISIPEYCDVRMEEPFVIINGNHLMTEDVQAQIILQVVAHYAKDCLELALKEWPHAHWERFKIENVHHTHSMTQYLNNMARKLTGGHDSSTRITSHDEMDTSMMSDDDNHSPPPEPHASPHTHPSQSHSSSTQQILDTSLSRQSSSPLLPPPLQKHILSACRTMHTVQAMKVTTYTDLTTNGASESLPTSTRYILNPTHETNAFRESDIANDASEQQQGTSDTFSHHAAIDSRAYEFSNVRIEKSLTWVRLTIYVLDAGDGLFYWLTGITESVAPQQIFQKRGLFSPLRPQRPPFIENQVTLYDAKLLDPIQHVIFSNDYEFPLWQECMWSAPYRLPNYDMEMRLPPIWRLVDNFYIISPIQLFSQNRIQEHFFFSLYQHPPGPNEVAECCAAIVQKNQQSTTPKVHTVNAFQKIVVSGCEGMYSIFRMDTPPGSLYPYIEKIVVNVRAVEGGQWVFSYISSYGFRSMNLWKQFLREIRIGNNFDHARHDKFETRSNNSQMFHEVYSTDQFARLTMSHNHMVEQDVEEGSLDDGDADSSTTHDMDDNSVTLESLPTARDSS